ncbi:hypothetical protein ACLOJK_038943, partial [Asimina triloba]
PMAACLLPCFLEKFGRLYGIGYLLPRVMLLSKFCLDVTVIVGNVCCWTETC